MNEKRAFHRGVMISKTELMVIGGWSGPGQTLKSCELYDKKTESRSLIADLKEARQYPGDGRNTNKIWIVEDLTEIRF